MCDRIRPAAPGDKCVACGVIPWPGEPVHPTPRGPECKNCHAPDDWREPPAPVRYGEFIRREFAAGQRKKPT